MHTSSTQQQMEGAHLSGSRSRAEPQVTVSLLVWNLASLFSSLGCGISLKVAGSSLSKISARVHLEAWESGCPGPWVYTMSIGLVFLRASTDKYHSQQSRVDFESRMAQAGHSSSVTK